MYLSQIRSFWNSSEDRWSLHSSPQHHQREDLCLPLVLVCRRCHLLRDLNPLQTDCSHGPQPQSQCHHGQVSLSSWQEACWRCPELPHPQLDWPGTFKIFGKILINIIVETYQWKSFILGWRLLGYVPSVKESFSSGNEGESENCKYFIFNCKIVLL